MALELGQLHNLMLGHADPLQIGCLPAYVIEQLGWRLPYVYLSKPTCEKLARKHQLKIEEFLHLPFAIQRGSIFLQPDRNDSVVAIYTNADCNEQYIVGMKPAAKTCEIWISTYHRTNRKQLMRLTQKAKMLKRHD